MRARFPEMPARQVVGRLLATAKDAGAPGKDDQTGYGIVRPLNALTENVPADAPNPVYEEVDRLRGTTAVPGHATTTTTRSTLPLVAAAVAGVAALLALLAILVTRRRRPPETANPAGRAFPPSRPGPGPGP